MFGRKGLLLFFFLSIFLVSTSVARADDFPPPPDSNNIQVAMTGAIFKQGWNYFTLGFEGCSAEGVLNELQANGGSALHLTNLYIKDGDSWDPYSFVNQDSANKKVGGDDLLSFYSTINFSMQINSATCTNQSFQRQKEIEQVRQGSVAQAQTSLIDKVQQLPSDLWNKLMNLLNNNNLQNPDKPVLDTLSVAGKTTVNNLGITGNISQGYLSVNGFDKDLSAATINTINNDLYIQNLGVGGVNFVNGKVVIDKNGDLKIIGGSLIVSGPSIGGGVLRAGTTSVTIQTTAVSSTSRIFVTPRSTTTEPLVAKNVVDGKSFDVTIASPYSSDINFDWWIVKTQ